MELKFTADKNLPKPKNPPVEVHMNAQELDDLQRFSAAVVERGLRGTTKIRPEDVSIAVAHVAFFARQQGETARVIKTNEADLRNVASHIIKYATSGEGVNTFPPSTGTPARTLAEQMNEGLFMGGATMEDVFGDFAALLEGAEAAPEE